MSAPPEKRDYLYRVTDKTSLIMVDGCGNFDTQCDYCIDWGCWMPEYITKHLIWGHRFNRGDHTTDPPLLVSTNVSREWIVQEAERRHQLYRNEVEVYQIDMRELK